MNRIKTIILIFLLSNLCLTQIKAQVSFGESVLINNDWKFILKDEPKALQADYNDHHWQKVDLPYDWSVKQQLSPTLASCQGYLPAGIGWYRKILSFRKKNKEKKYSSISKGFTIEVKYISMDNYLANDLMDTFHLCMMLRHTSNMGKKI